MCPRACGFPHPLGRGLGPLAFLEVVLDKAEFAVPPLPDAFGQRGQ
jgi:hypothetical protein